MIDKKNIKYKDITFILPDIIIKLQFIAASLINAGITKEDTPKEDILYGSGIILTEIFEDLALINNVIYDKPKVD